MKKSKLLMTVLPLTCLGGAIAPIITSCNRGPIVAPDVSFDEAQKSKSVATWGIPLTSYDAVYNGFKFAKFTKEEISKMTVSVENLSGFAGTATPTINNIGDNTFDVTINFKPTWTYIEHSKVSFDLKFTSGENEAWEKTVSGFYLVFSNNIVTVTRDNENRKEQKIYKGSGSSADVVLKTDFEFWVNGQAADDKFLDTLDIVDQPIKNDDVTIEPEIVKATGGAIYVVLNIQNFTDTTIDYKFSFKNDTYGWESETYEFKLELTTDSNQAFEFYSYEEKQWIVRECNSCEENITVPDTMAFGSEQLVTKIDRYAFHYCANMESITIGKNIKEIDVDGGNPFYGCYKLASINVDQDNANFSSVDSAKTGCNCIMNKEATKIIAGCKTTSVTDTVKEIGAQAFNGCLGLEEILLNEVTTIESGAFQGCINLTKVTAPKVNRMYNYAFSWCSSLVDITLGDELTTLYHNVFEYCDSIKKLTLPKKIASVSGDCFVGCKNLEEITIDSDKYTSKPDGVERNGIFEKSTNDTLKLIRGCKNTQMIEGITTIAEDAFAGCEFTAVIIPSTVTTIGNGAFAGCIKLSSVILPENVTSIGNSCFADCYALSNVKIEGDVTEIKPWTFKNCYILNPIDLPDTLKIIGSAAFENNYYMETITIPGSVTEINDDSFKNCAYLKSAKFQVTNGWIQNIIGKEPQAIDPAELADSAKAAYYLVNKLPGFGWKMERK